MNVMPIPPAPIWDCRRSDNLRSRRHPRSRPEPKLSPSKSRPVLRAPEGRNILAQGNALGIRETNILALKGRDIGRSFVHPGISRPLPSAVSQARLRAGFISPGYPGRCPGLVYQALSGQRKFSDNLFQDGASDGASSLRFFKGERTENDDGRRLRWTILPPRNP